METVYLIIIFIVPGLMYKSIEHTLDIKIKKESKGTIYEQSYYIVANSVVISVVSIILMKKLHFIDELPQNLDELIISMKDFIFLGKFAAVVAAITIAWYFLCEGVIKKISFKLKNWYFLKRYNVEFSSPSARTTWEEIILSQDKNGHKPLIAVYDGVDFITAGFLDMYDQGTFSDIGLCLARTKRVTKMFKEDVTKTDEDKLFKKIVQEYYDVESGKRIVFFDNEAIYKHWDS